MRLGPVILGSALLFGCAGREASDTQASAASESDETATESHSSVEGASESELTGEGDGDGDAQGDGDGEPNIEIIARVRGQILDAQGEPLPTPSVSFSGPIGPEDLPDIHYPISVEPDGSFEAEVWLPGLWALKIVHAPLEGRFFSGQTLQVTLEEGQDVELSPPPIVLPELAELIDLSEVVGEVALEFEAGLTLHLDPSLAVTPAFTAPQGLGALAAEAAHWPKSDVEGEVIVAAWAFMPYGVRAKEGSFGIELDAAELGLEVGTPLTFHQLNPITGSTEVVATGLVGEMGVELSSVGEGLTGLSWLFLTQ